MKLIAKDGASFELRIEGYEFPDEELEPNEDNPADDFETGRFLIISVSANHPNGSWRATGPIMTTTEMESLANWFDSITAGKVSTPGIYFTERDLEFTINDDVSVVQVHFFYQFLPAWSKKTEHPEHVVLDFPVGKIDLTAAGKSLREQLVAFPGRPIPTQRLIEST